MERHKYISQLSEGDRVDDVFFVEEKSVRTSRGGRKYMDLKLADRTGSINCKVWDEVDHWDKVFTSGEFVKVQATVETYRDNLQLRFFSLVKVSPDSIDRHDFIESIPQEQIENYFNKILKYVEEMENVHLKKLLEAFLLDREFQGRFMDCPAARNIHHDHVGGLVKHIRAMLATAKFLKMIYKDIDLDLLIAGIILHDIGKIRELESDVTISYTVEGELVGHAVLGIEMIKERAAQIPDFPTRLELLLVHMLLSHHGLIEYGAVNLPRFREAMLLHLIDSIDAKMEIFSKSMKKTPENEIWSDKVWALENLRMMNIEAFLNGKDGSPVEQAEEQAETQELAEEV